MNRLVYVGGFGNGPASEAIHETLRHGWNVEDIDSFTFAEAMAQPERVAKAARGVLCVSHSAGLMALDGTSPEVIHAFNPPLPTKIPSLLARTGLKTAGMFVRGFTDYGISGIKAAAVYSQNSATELGSHPVANLRHLPKIAKANAIKIAGEAAKNEVSIFPSWTQHDNYFYPSVHDYYYANRLGVSIESELPGEHDEFVLRPELFMHNYKKTIGYKMLDSRD